MSEVRGKPGKSDVKEVDRRGEYATGRLSKGEAEKEKWDLALWRLLVTMTKALETYHTWCWTHRQQSLVPFSLSCPPPSIYSANIY